MAISVNKPPLGGRSVYMLNEMPYSKRGRGVPTVQAPDAIDENGADWLAASLLESAAEGHAKLVVDVSSTPFADPAGLRLLVHAHGRALAEGRAHGLAIPSVIIRRAPGIFWLSELARRLPED
jgi:anti-anti-sigma regulatory factor